MESAIFAPSTGRLDTPVTAVYGIFQLKIKYYINMALYSRLQVPTPDREITVAS